jgi:hypothetical protein
MRIKTGYFWNIINQRNLSMDRKHFFKQFGLMGAAAVGAGALLTACGGGEEKAAVDPCTDLTGLSQGDLDMRNNLAYVTETAVEGQNCANCQLLKAPEGGSSCSGCLLFKGPVTQNGWCKNWVVKVTV